MWDYPFLKNTFRYNIWKYIVNIGLGSGWALVLEPRTEQNKLGPIKIGSAWPIGLKLEAQTLEIYGLDRAGPWHHPLANK